VCSVFCREYRHSNHSEGVVFCTTCLSIVFAAQCYASAAYAVMQCRMSVRLSITFVNFVKTSNGILRRFPPSGSQTILVFPDQTSWQYSDGNSLTGASNAGVVDKNRDSRRISGYRSMTAGASAINNYN